MPGGSPGEATRPADPTDDQLAERIVDRRILHRGRYLTFEVDTIERADGTRSERDIAAHPGAVAIVAIDAEDRVLLVRQWRTPVGGLLLEIPAGGLDVDDATGATEDPDLAAPRELEEETGYRAGSWKKLTSFWSAPGFTSELMHVYLATDLSSAHPDDRLGPDEDEHLRLERLAFADAVAAVESGRIADAKSVAGILWVDRMRRQSTAAQGVDRGQEPDDLTVPLRTFTPTIGEYADAAGRIARGSSSSLFVGGFFVVLGLVNWAIDQPAVGITSVVVGLLIATGLLSSLLSAFVAFRRRDSMQRPRTVGFGPGGMVHRTAESGGWVRWDHYRSIQRSGPFLIFDLGHQKGFIPLRPFTAGEQVEIRRLLQEAGFGSSGRRRRRPA